MKKAMKKCEKKVILWLVIGLLIACSTRYRNRSAEERFIRHPVDAAVRHRLVS